MHPPFVDSESALAEHEPPPEDPAHAFAAKWLLMWAIAVATAASSAALLVR